MIDYTEKGIAAHDLVIAAGYKLNHNNTQAFDNDGNQSAAIDAAVQSIIDSYDPLPDAQNKAIKKVTGRADSLILAAIPITKQLSLLAEASMLSAKPARGKGNLSAGDLTRLDEIEAINAYPVSVRAAADIEEARLLAITDWTLCTADFSGIEAI